MPSENTGYKAYSNLQKVVNGGPHDGELLDVNDQLCSITGLPPASKPNNTGDADYVAPVYDTASCPLPDTTTTTTTSSTTTSTTTTTTITTEAPPVGANVSVEMYDAVPQTGGTNRYGARIVSDRALQENIVVDFSANYDGGAGSYSNTITLPAGETVYDLGFVINDASPAASTPFAIINSSTPSNGDTVHDFSTGDPLILNLS